MSNNYSSNNPFANLLKSAASFLNSFFVSSSTKEFNRLKNFIAS